jgi:hypothetical protein
MPRMNRPANEAADSQKSNRTSTRGNGSAEPSNDPDEVARRAYEIYQKRGGQHGADLDDWLEAERQLRPGPSDVTGPSPAKPKRRKTSEQTGL